MFTKFHHIWTNPSRGFRCRTLNFGVFSYASATQNRGSQGLYDKTVSRIILKPFPVDRTYKILLLYIFSAHLVHFRILDYSVLFGDFYDSQTILTKFSTYINPVLHAHFFSGCVPTAMHHNYGLHFST